MYQSRAEDELRPQVRDYRMIEDIVHSCGMVNRRVSDRGLIQLALRSGYYKRLNVLAVKAGELRKWNPLTEEIDIKLIEDDTVREKTATIGYYASFEYLNGFTKAMYWSREKMESHALRYSKGYAAKKNYTFWEKDFDAMAYKTMLRQLISKWGIMSIDLQTAYADEGAVMKLANDKVEVDYIQAEEATLPAQQEPEALPEPAPADSTPNGGGQMGLDDL